MALIIEVTFSLKSRQSPVHLSGLKFGEETRLKVMSDARYLCIRYGGVTDSQTFTTPVKDPCFTVLQLWPLVSRDKSKSAARSDPPPWGRCN
jgi:hypothetical protein